MKKVFLTIHLSWRLIKPVYAVLLCIGAIIGVTCLMMVLSLMRNYYLSSENVFMGLHPHIEIHKDGMTQQEGDAIIRRLQKEFPEILLIEPALYRSVTTVIAEVNTEKAHCVRNGEQLTCYSPENSTEPIAATKYGFFVAKKQQVEFMLRGVSITQGETVTEIQRLITGFPDLERLRQTEDVNHNPLPYGFFMEQQVFDVLPPAHFLLSFPAIDPRSFHFRLGGVLNMGTHKGEIPLLVMSLENAQRCLQLPNQINTIEIKLSEPYQGNAIAREIESVLNDSFEVMSWTQQEEAAFAFLTTIRWMGVALVSSIMLVAAISIFSTLYLTVMENRKKIAILKALGMKSSDIHLIFLFSTVMIGLVGLTVGGILGYSGSLASVTYFADTLQNLGITDPQVHIRFSDIGLLILVTGFLFLPTSFIPARQAVRSEIVDALHDRTI